MILLLVLPLVICNWTILSHPQIHFLNCHVFMSPSRQLVWKKETFLFRGWKYSHYFDFVSRKDEKNIIVKWKLCAGRGNVTKTLSTAKNTTSNLLKHQIQQHKVCGHVGSLYPYYIKTTKKGFSRLQVTKNLWSLSLTCGELSLPASPSVLWKYQSQATKDPKVFYSC